jgi:hypothetical protein
MKDRLISTYLAILVPGKVNIYKPILLQKIIDMEKNKTTCTANMYGLLNEIVNTSDYTASNTLKTREAIYV